MLLNICDVPDVLKVMRIVNIVITIIKASIPIVLMISLMIDYLRAEVSNDSSLLSKVNKLSVNKAIAVILLFMIPTFVKIITNVVAPGFEYSNCINNANENGINQAYESQMKTLLSNAKEKEDNSSYLLATNYLKNIKNEELKNKYTTELEEVNKKIEEKEKKREEENKKHQSPSSSENQTTPTQKIDPLTPYTPGSLADASFLQTAKNVWDRMVLGNLHFSYHNGNSIPIMNDKCDCSAYVSWVIYEYGYKDWAGWQRNTSILYHTNYQALYGWEEHYYDGRTNLTNLVQPGDIIVRRGNGNGHTDIIASVSNGVIRAYDCGSSEAVSNHKYPDGFPNPGFLKDEGKFRPAKIIKVKKQ